jgi:hypothetical protein
MATGTYIHTFGKQKNSARRHLMLQITLHFTELDGVPKMRPTWKDQAGVLPFANAGGRAPEKLSRLPAGVFGA